MYSKYMLQKKSENKFILFCTHVYHWLDFLVVFPAVCGILDAEFILFAL
jgi:hypothetical protein